MRLVTHQRESGESQEGFYDNCTAQKKKNDMPQIERDEGRENRIHDEVIVDAYSAEDQAMGWYYYLAESMSFPFEARCVREMRKSPLRLNEIITVTDMISDEGSDEMLVEITLNGRTQGVPLEQIEPLDTDSLTRQVIEDWHYWISRGYEFG
jgi:hypothetical protein